MRGSFNLRAFNIIRRGYIFISVTYMHVIALNMPCYNSVQNGNVILSLYVLIINITFLLMLPTLPCPVECIPQVLFVNSFSCIDVYYVIRVYVFQMNGIYMDKRQTLHFW